MLANMAADCDDIAGRGARGMSDGRRVAKTGPAARGEASHLADAKIVPLLLQSAMFSLRNDSRRSFCVFNFFS